MSGTKPEQEAPALAKPTQNQREEQSNTLDVFIGAQKKIATLRLRKGSEAELEFIYEPQWVKQGFPLSPYMPLHGAIPSNAIRNYLQNLLPEGQGLEDITANTTISKNNTFGLIRIIGAETSGALSFRSAFRSDSVIRYNSNLGCG